MVMSPGCDSFITTSSATGANFRFIERTGGIIGLSRVELISHAFYSPRLLEENTIRNKNYNFELKINVRGFDLINIVLMHHFLYLTMIKGFINILYIFKFFFLVISRTGHQNFAQALVSYMGVLYFASDCASLYVALVTIGYDFKCVVHIPA